MVGYKLAYMARINVTGSCLNFFMGMDMAYPQLHVVYSVFMHACVCMHKITHVCECNCSIHYVCLQMCFYLYIDAHVLPNVLFPLSSAFRKHFFGYVNWYTLS